MGKLENIYQHGSLFYRYAKLKGKDFFLTWLHHLIINQIHPQQTHFISMDQQLVFPSTDHQPNILLALIDIYQLGQKKPDVFFTDAAFNYVKQADKLNTSNRAKTPAILTTQTEFIKQMEYDKPMYQLFHQLEDLTELFNEDFENQCKQLILPAWVACHE
jgi:exodeoxyribonuclease V gamma subunit